jgi:hypothetical protein
VRAGGPRVRTLACACLLAATSAAAEGVRSPESFLGFRPGADRRLADWNQVVSYFEALDRASPRITTQVLGRSTEGRPFLLVIATSEANMARLAEIRRDQLRLADPRGLSDDEAGRLLRDGKTIVASLHGTHSSEVASTLTAMELAYRLALASDPRLAEILDATVVLIIPSQNPDGTQRVAEYQRRTLGTPYEGGPLPFPYHPYVGHDNNRDWYMQALPETRLAVEHVLEEWRPQILHDLHQMATRGARLFLPPYLDPYEPNVDPALRAATTALGAQMAARLIGEGKRGVVVHALYDAWSPTRTYVTTHGGVRILSECASLPLASPLRVAFEELEPGLGYDPRRVSWNFPVPWPGGDWRLADVVDYQLSASFALLEHAARNRARWLAGFLDVNRRAARRSVPPAFLVPAHQSDAWATSRLLEVLRRGGVEIARARQAFEAEGRRFPAGSLVIPMAQPASAFAKMLLERQSYPDLRLGPEAAPQRAYDATAHTLPLLMGVDVVEAKGRVKVELEPLRDVRPAPGHVDGGRGRALAFPHKSAGLVALGRLLAAGVPVRWVTTGFVDRGRTFPAGTLLAPPSARPRLAAWAAELGLDVSAVSAQPAALVLAHPRVGLYQSFVSSPDEGWTRFVFEHHVGLHYEILHDAQVRAGSLRARFDAIVLPDARPEDILNGHPAGAVPPEYTGGLGAPGVDSLRTFVEGGGTLIALNSACDFAIDALALPVTNVLRDLTPSPRHGGEPQSSAVAPRKEFYCPGSILRARLEGDDPLGHGLERETPLWFENGPAFDIGSGRAVLRYPDGPLLSGWLLGGERLRGHAALAVLSLGRGRVVLFGFRPQYRAQSWATYIPFLNALYTSAAR